MTQIHTETLARIQAYASKARELQDGRMDVDVSATEMRLEQTVRELQTLVKEQQIALEDLRASSSINMEQAAYASHDPREKLKQLRIVKQAYEQLTRAPTLLPPQNSVLPALLAARSLQSNVQGNKNAIKATQDQIKHVEATLRREEQSLRDAQLMHRAMEDRITRLREQQEDRSQRTPAQLAKELIAAKRAQKEAYDQNMKRLGESLNDFINDHLSAMLAAEELGGPVVGDMLDVGDETLAAGFTKKGKAKAGKKPVSDKARQRRIDQIWGDKAAAEEEEEEPLTEAEAADNEMRQLIGDLSNVLTGPGGGQAYYKVDRDSAALRFLIRANIAQFHPKDARRVRLIDFGRGLDD